MERWQYEQFSRVDSQHWWFEARRQIAGVMMSHMSLGDGAQIIDVGTGTGGMVPVLSRYGKLTAYEPDEQTLKFTSDTYRVSFPDVSFISGAWSNLKPLDGCFDVLTAFDVLEHCADDAQTLTEWRKLLKPGGRLLLTVPAFQCLWGANDELSHHYRRYTRHTLMQVLEGADLHVSKISYMNSINFLPLWVSRNVKERLERLMRSGESQTPWDFSLPPKSLNSLLLASFAWEKNLLPFASLPIGTSLIVIATVPSGSSRPSQASRTSLVLARGRIDE